VRAEWTARECHPYPCRDYISLTAVASLPLRENSLHALTVGNAAHGKCFVQPAAFAPDDDSCEYLDSFFVAFYHPRVNADAVAHLERVRVGFLLLFFDGTDDLVHDNSFQSGDGELPTRGGELQLRRIQRFAD